MAENPWDQFHTLPKDTKTSRWSKFWSWICLCLFFAILGPVVLGICVMNGMSHRSAIPSSSSSDIMALIYPFAGSSLLGFLAGVGCWVFSIFSDRRERREQEEKRRFQEMVQHAQEVQRSSSADKSTL